MKQGWHRFHCTDGRCIVADLRGTYVRSAGELVAKARRHLAGVRAAMPDGLNWSAWVVDVHDARGRHVAFVEPEDGLPAPPPVACDRGVERPAETRATPQEG